MSSNTTTTTLHPRDFARTTTEANRNEWTRGQLDAVVAALGGAQVLIEVDRSTGFTVLATLARTTDGSYTNNWGALLVVTEHTTTAYRVPDIGSIVVMPGQELPQGRGAKWVALDNYRALQQEGIRAARKVADAAGYTEVSFEAIPYGGGRVGWAITERIARADGTRYERQVDYGTVTGVSLEPTPAP